MLQFDSVLSEDSRSLKARLTGSLKWVEESFSQPSGKAASSKVSSKTQLQQAPSMKILSKAAAAAVYDSELYAVSPRSSCDTPGPTQMPIKQQQDDQDTELPDDEGDGTPKPTPKSTNLTGQTTAATVYTDQAALSTSLPASPSKITLYKVSPTASKQQVLLESKIQAASATTAAAADMSPLASPRQNQLLLQPKAATATARHPDVVRCSLESDAGSSIVSPGGSSARSTRSTGASFVRGMKPCYSDMHGTLQVLSVDDEEVNQMVSYAASSRDCSCFAFLFCIATNL